MALDGDTNGSDYSEEDESDDVEVQGKLDQHNTMLGGIARIGRVVEFKVGADPTDPADIPRVLVQIGGSSEGSYIRNWLPWITTRAGYDAEWWQPELDEQVVVLAPSGNVAQGIIIGSLYRGNLMFGSEVGGRIGRKPIPIPGGEGSTVDKHIHQRIYQDGTSISYDKKKHELKVELKNISGDEAIPKLIPSLQFIATMVDPKGEGAIAGTGQVTLQIGKEAAPDIKITVDSTGGMGGELQVVSTLKTTLIAGSLEDPKAKVLVDASAAAGGEISIEAKGDVSVTTAANVTIAASGNVGIFTEKGTIDIDGSGGVNITGDVVITGSLDVKA